MRNAVPVPALRWLAVAAAMSWCLPGCTTPRTTERMRMDTLRAAESGRYADAHAEINALYDSHFPGELAEVGGKPQADLAVGDKQALIWHMESGLVEHLAGDLALSDRHLDAAAELVDERRTKTLVTEGATFLTNETLRDYAGWPFEHIQVDYYRALNRLLMAEQREGLYAPLQLAVPALRPGPTGTAVAPFALTLDDVPAADNFDRAINFARRMTINQLRETADAAGSNRYHDDPFGRVLAAALTECPRRGDRSEGNRQFADIQLKQAVKAYAEEARILGGKQPFRHEVRGRPALLDTLLVRISREYDPEGFDQHLADYGFAPGDPRLKQAALAPGHGMVLVLNNVGFLAHPEVLDVRIMASSFVPLPVPTAAERDGGVTVSVFRIGAIGFYAKGPGSEVVNAWGAIPVPPGIVEKLLAPGGAAFMGFALPVHRPDRPIAPPATARAKPMSGGSEITRTLEVVADLDAYARAALKDDQPQLVAKTLIRAASKQVAGGTLAHEAKKRGGDLLGLAVNLVTSTAATLSEVADTRAWTTLPDHIEATLIDLPAGTYALDLDTRSAALALGTVTVPAGRLVVVPVRTFPEPLPPSKP
jgi:hypothetical protein